MFIKKIFELRLRLRDLYRGYGLVTPLSRQMKMSRAITPHWTIGLTWGQEIIIDWTVLFPTNCVSKSADIRMMSKETHLLAVFIFS